MESLLYALAFFPLIILTALTVHEAGHLAAAIVCGVKPVSFQIGLGPKMLAVHAGKNHVKIPPGPHPAPGSVIHYWASGLEKDNTEAVHWRYAGKKREITEAERELNRTLPRFTARVRTAREGEITAADLELALCAIPLAAMVHLAEAPENRTPGSFNAAGWPKQMLIILAGAAANALLLLAVMAALALLPVNRPAIIVREVEPQSPAQAAGLQPGDVITRSGNTLLPGPAQLRQTVADARGKSQDLSLTVSREGEPLHLTVPHRADRDTIGIRFETGRITSGAGENLADRFLNIGKTYGSALAAVFHHTGIRPQQDADAPPVNGIVMAGAATGQAINAAGVQGFLAMLGVITMSMAIINLLPVPPLDGYQLVTRSLRALKGGRPLNARAERLITALGLAAIAAAAVYLALQDIIILLTA